MDVEKEQCCGNCAFFHRSILLCDKDAETVQRVFKEVKMNAGGGYLNSENLIDLLLIVKRLSSQKCWCNRESIWTHWLDSACSLWLPQGTVKCPADRKQRH